MILKRFTSGPLAVNCYFVADEIDKKAFIVDPGGVNPDLIKFVEDNCYKVSHIILTHGHSDHIGGVQPYAAMFGSKVLAHEDEAPILNKASLNFSREVYGKVIELEADSYVKDGDELDIGHMHLKFIHTPGHSPGGMCILVGGYLFSGDTLFAESVGRTDFPYSSFNDLMKAVQEKLFTLPNDTVVYPGHMGETTIGHEKEYNPFV